MLLYYSPQFLQHQTGTHPERPARLEHVWRHLQREGLDVQCEQPAWQPISSERLARVHHLEYLDELRDFVARGGGRIEVDTVVSPHSLHVAGLAAGAAADAVERVLRGDDRRALCLVRPPGHHALDRAAMGFCLLNNVAVAARVATTEFQLDRVLIVDWDVHHGNGTQDAFWTDGRVGVFSIHRWPFYPGTGQADETGRGDGLGSNRNVPVEFGISRAGYLKAFRHELESFADRIRPQLVLVSAGFDSHALDPVGSLGLESEDFQQLTQIVLAVAEQHAQGRVVSVLEGGYNPPILAGCVEIHLREMLSVPKSATE